MHVYNSFSEVYGPLHCRRGTRNGDGLGMLGLEIQVTLVFMFWEEYQCFLKRNQILIFVITFLSKCENVHGIFELEERMSLHLASHTF